MEGETVKYVFPSPSKPGTRQTSDHQINVLLYFQDVGRSQMLIYNTNTRPGGLPPTTAQLLAAHSGNDSSLP